MIKDPSTGEGSNADARMRRARLQTADRELDRRNRELREQRFGESTAQGPVLARLVDPELALHVERPLEAELEHGAWIEAELGEAATVDELHAIAKRMKPGLQRPEHALLSLALYVTARRQWEDWQCSGSDDEPSPLAAMYRDLMERDK